MASYKEFHKRSVEDRNGFWGEQAQLIHWNKVPEQIYDFSKPPFVKWFVGGETNLCYNAVDRHAETNPNGKALVYISTETDEEKIYSFSELRTEVMRIGEIVLEAFLVAVDDAVFQDFLDGFRALFFLRGGAFPAFEQRDEILQRIVRIVRRTRRFLGDIGKLAHARGNPHSHQARQPPAMEYTSV